MRICKLDSRNLGQTSRMDCFKHDADTQAFHNSEKFFCQAEHHLPSKYVGLLCYVYVFGRVWNSDSVRKERDFFQCLIYTNFTDLGQLQMLASCNLEQVYMTITQVSLLTA